MVILNSRFHKYDCNCLKHSRLIREAKFVSSNQNVTLYFIFYHQRKHFPRFINQHWVNLLRHYIEIRNFLLNILLILSTLYVSGICRSLILHVGLVLFRLQQIFDNGPANTKKCCSCKKRSKVTPNLTIVVFPRCGLNLWNTYELKMINLSKDLMFGKYCFYWSKYELGHFLGPASQRICTLRLDMKKMLSPDGSTKGSQFLHYSISSVSALWAALYKVSSST